MALCETANKLHTRLQTATSTTESLFWAASLFLKPLTLARGWAAELLWQGSGHDVAPQKAAGVIKKSLKTDFICDFRATVSPVYIKF